MSGRDWAEEIVHVVRPAVHGMMGRMQASGVPFANAHSALVGALMNELAEAIACAPARTHRAQTKIVVECLPALVIEAAVAQRRRVPETDA